MANVCDPNYTFLAKLHKQYLPRRTVYGGVHTRLRDVGRTYLAERAQGEAPAGSRKSGSR